MDIKKSFLPVLFLILLVNELSAGNLDLGDDLIPGSPAVASDVNAKFQAIEDAINAIQDQLSGLNCSTATEVDGEYRFIYMSVGVGWANDKSFAHNSSTSASGDICFSGDGSFTGIDRSLQYVEVADEAPVRTSIDNELETFSGTYTVGSDCSITLTEPEALTTFYMNPSLTIGAAQVIEQESLCNTENCTAADDPVGVSHHGDLVLLVKKGPGSNTNCQ
jgi:hypothetical protein